LKTGNRPERPGAGCNIAASTILRGAGFQKHVVRIY